jgi:hypothetical protein
MEGQGLEDRQLVSKALLVATAMAAFLLRS